MIRLAPGFEDRLYEAAAVPELWPALLGEFATAISGRGAVLVAKRADDLRWVASSEEFAAMVTEHYRHREGADRTSRLLGADHPGFLSESDLWTDAELSRSRLYQDFLIPGGYGRSVATAIHSPGNETFIFHAEGRRQLGPIPAETIRLLDAVRPHMARAALLSARLGFERAKVIAGTLESLGIPALVLSARGLVLALSKQAEDLVPSIVMDRRARLAFTDRRVDRVFWDSFCRLTLGRSYDGVFSFPVKCEEPFIRAIAHLIPLAGAAFDVFGGGDAIVVFSRVGLREASSAAIIAGLFDLTPGEARVAKSIGEGLTVEQIAQANKVSIATVRVHVKRILHKIGASRQAEIVGLVQGIAAPYPATKN